MKTLFNMLPRKICVVCTIVLLLVVAAVFFAPSVDLEPSALRAIRAAVLFFFAILVVARLLIQVYHHLLPVELGVHEHPPLESPRPPDLNLLDLHCSLLC